MRRDEEAKAHEATRGQSPPLRGRCSWKTPPLTASFLTSPRSQTGALPAPAFLSCWRAYPQHGSQERQTTEEVRRSQEEHTSHAGGRQKRGPKPLPPSCWRAYPQHGSQERQTTEEVRRSQEEHTSHAGGRQKRGPKPLPPAGRPAVRPSAGTAQGDGCREQPGSACTREPPEEPPAASRQPSSRNPNQEPKQGRSRGRGRTTASAGREAPGRDAALSRRSHSESGALREGSHRSQAANSAPSRFSSRQPSGGGA